MKRTLSLVLVLFFCLGTCCINTVAAPKDVSQKTVVTALQKFLSEHAPGSLYQKTVSGQSKTENIAFSHELFSALFDAELGGEAIYETNDGKTDSEQSENAASGEEKTRAVEKILGLDLGASDALTALYSAEGASAKKEEIHVARSTLEIGYIVQYGVGGHISFYLGEVDETHVALYDCGMGGDARVRLRLVSESELVEQANENGLLFFAYNDPAGNYGNESSKALLNLHPKPKKLSYYVGEETSAEGALLLYKYGEKGEKEISPENENLHVYASTAETGEVPMLFLYDGALAFCKIEVLDQTVEKIELKTKPKKLSYTSEEQPDMAGAVILATLVDGKTVSLKPEDYTLEYDFTLSDGESEAEKTVRVLYCGQACEFTVKVTEPEVTNLRVHFEKTSYFIGDPLDFMGAYLQYDTKHEKDQRAQILINMISHIDINEPGEKTLTVSYRGATATFTVTYHEKEVVSLALKTKLNERYREGAALDLKGIELIVTYGDSTTEIITADKCETKINGEMASEFLDVGTAKVVFSYRGVSTAPETVTVKQAQKTSFLPWLIVLLVCFIAVPAAVLLTLYFVRRKKEEEQPASPAPEETLEVEEEFVASFDEIENGDDEDGDVRVYEQKSAPKIELTTELTQTPEDYQGHTRKIDFFDDL